MLTSLAQARLAGASCLPYIFHVLWCLETHIFIVIQCYYVISVAVGTKSWQKEGGHTNKSVAY